VGEPLEGDRRNHGLDGRRGIAALSVALGHCVLQVTGLPLFGSLSTQETAVVYRPAGLWLRPHLSAFSLAVVSAPPLGLLTAAGVLELARNMLLLSNSLNGVLWSLQVEVIAS
jgi:hypothetical protein